MKKKFFAVALALVLLAGAVAVGVHVLNREAKAATNHVVWAFFWDDEEQIWRPAEACVVLFTLKTGPNPEDWDTFERWTNEIGKASCNEEVNTAATFWTAEITDAQGLVLQDWDENPKDIEYPQTTANFWFE